MESNYHLYDAKSRLHRGNLYAYDMPLCLLVLIILMSIEGKYTHSQRATFFGLDEAPIVEHHGKKEH